MIHNLYVFLRMIIRNPFLWVSNSKKCKTLDMSYGRAGNQDKWTLEIGLVVIPISYMYSC